MNSSRRVLSLGQLAFREFSKTATKNSGEVMPARIQKLKEKQKKFQIEDGVPVYLKTGFADRAMFGATCILTALGMGLSIQTFCALAFK